MVLQAILVAIISTISGWWFSHLITRTWLYPIWNGFLVALVMGEPIEGMKIAAAINLPLVGFVTAGGSMPSNAQFAGSVGTALAIAAFKANGSMTVEQCVAISTIVGGFGTFVWTAYMTVNANWVHMADKFLAEGNIKMVRVMNYVPSCLVSIVLNGIPGFCAVMYGEAFGHALAAFPQWIMDAFTLAGGILPALGIGMLLNYLAKDKIYPYYFLGFALSAFFGISTMEIVVCGVIIAAIVYLNGNKEVA